ncbi:TMhelix containing protein [Vibrio phage 1.029.O._10N.261.55.A7]|nr:TMhelix containing protein [Vibrio phage 1.029.O._10N.261.55.A7]
MTIQLLAKITPSQQQAAIDLSKNKPQNVIEMAEGETAIFEMSQTWHKTEDWVKRYLAATFMIMVAILGGFQALNPDVNQDFERVRITRTRTRKREDV